MGESESKSEVAQSCQTLSNPMGCSLPGSSVHGHSAFFIVQISHPYTTTGKTIALTRRTFVGKVMSLLFNLLSRLVITFLPRSSVQFSHSVMSYSLRPHGLQPPGSSIRGILQARVLEGVAISFSRGSSQSRDPTWVSCIGGRRFTI